MQRKVSFASGAALLGLLLAASGAAQGAHDLWASTAVYVAALLGLAATLLLSAWSTEDPGLPVASAPWAALVAAAMALSWRFSINPGESLLGLADWLCALVLFFAALRAFREASAAEVFLACLAPFLAFEAVVMVVQHARVVDPFNHQAPGTFPNAHGAVAFVLPWIPPLAARTFGGSGQGNAPRWYWAMGLAGALACIPLAESVWGLLCVLLAAPFMLGLGPLKSWLTRHRVGAGAAAGAAAVFLAWVLWKKLHVSFQLAGPAMASGGHFVRLKWWASAWQMFLAHPWLGVGPDCFASAYPAFRDPSAALNVRASHSLVLGSLAETGLIGAGSLAAFCAWWALRLKRRWAAVSDRWPFLLGLVLFASFAVVNVAAEYLATLLSAALCLALLAAPAAEPWWAPRKSAALVASALLLASLPWVVSPWMGSRLCVEGRAALEAGDLDRAARAFSAAIEVQPPHFEPERGLALVHAARHAATDDTAALAEAVASQERAVGLNPLDPILRLELGTYLAASGRAAEALAALDQADVLERGRPFWKDRLDALRRKLRRAGSDPAGGGARRRPGVIHPGRRD
ncbi:MAG: O-antigen ligase family protein [Elusimicrobia bacterium]|nr:O-antigen ligase family protein [Elusimicrobiota bacterium]